MAADQIKSYLSIFQVLAGVFGKLRISFIERFFRHSAPWQAGISFAATNEVLPNRQGGIYLHPINGLLRRGLPPQNRSA
jgi:hypothetical protein